MRLSFCRSFASLPLLLTTLLVIAVAATSVPARAQTPVYGVTVNNLDQALIDLEYLGAAVGNPALAASVKGFIDRISGGQGLRGVATGQALALNVTDVNPQGRPTGLLALLPLASTAGFEQLLQQLLGPTARVSENPTQLSGGQQPLYGRLQDNRYYLSFNPNALDNPGALIGDAAGVSDNADFALRLGLSRLPPALTEGIIAQSKANSERQLQQLEAGGQVTPGNLLGQRLGRELALAAIEGMITGGDQLRLITDIDRERRRVSLTLTLDARPGSPLQQQLRSFTAAQPLAADARPALAAVDMSLPVAEPIADGFNQLLTEVIGQTLAEREPQNAEQERVQQQLQTVFDEIGAVIDSTLRNDRLTFSGRLWQNDNNGFGIVGGLRLADAERLDKVLEVLQAESGGQMALDVAAAGSARVHRIELNGDAAVVQFTGSRALYLGRRGDEFWFLLGAQSPDRLTALLNNAGNTAAVTPLQINIRPQRLAAAAQNPATATTAGDGPLDFARLTADLHDGALRLQLDAGEAALRLLGGP